MSKKHNCCIECKYIPKPKSDRLLEVLRKLVRKLGFRTCKNCDSLGARYRKEWIAIKNFETSNPVKVIKAENHIFVQSRLGFWRIDYLVELRQFELFHRNKTNKKLNLEKPELEKYHKQFQVNTKGTIKSLLRYIVKHDEGVVKNATAKTTPKTQKKKKRQICFFVLLFSFP
jgi:hypothetical protein